MADFFFFTDVDLLNPQQQSEAFGPVGVVSGKDAFRVTSLHTASTNPKAYAICKGIALVQNDTNDSTLVNLILRPIDQPGFDFPKIKYFIYRGILKDELINGDDVAAKTNNDLTKSLWTSQEARNKSANTTGNPPMEAVGIDLSTSLEDSASMDEAFYRDNVNFQLPVVSAGWSLGKFKSSKFGIEIMVESIGFDPPMSKVRNGENRIEVRTLSSSPTQPEEFEHWHDKEEILNYIDPCAFFGMFYHTKIRVKQSFGTSNKLKENEVYDNLLIKFYNKNTIYLDIRNEYNYSYNYFKNYGTLVKIAFDNIATPELLNYYRSGWPILILVNIDFPLANPTNRNIIRIQMPYENGDNASPLIYISVAFLSTSYPKPLNGKDRFIYPAILSDFTEEISLMVLNRNGQSVVNLISSYIKLKYNRRFNEDNITPSSGTILRKEHYLDNMFAPFDLKVLFSGNHKINYAVYDDEKYIDVPAPLNFESISSVGIANNGANVSFFSLPKHLRREEVIANKQLSITSAVDNESSNILSVIAKKTKNDRVRRGVLIINGQAREYLELVTKDIDRISDFKNAFTGTFISIAIPLSILSSFEISGFLSKYRIYLGVSNGIFLTDDQGQPYKVFNLTLRGFELNSGVIQVKNLLTDYKIYYHGNNV